MAHQEGRNVFSLAVAAFATVALVGAAVPSDADLYRGVFARLRGSQETPPVITTADGHAVVDLDTTTNKIYWIVDHDVASPTAAHFHGTAFPGIAAPVLIDIAALSGGLASPMVGWTTLTAQQASDLLTGRWYVNIHSTTYPGGEIRGQLAAASHKAPLYLFPASGHLARTTGFDLTLYLNTGAATLVSGSVTLNGTDVTSAFLGCVRPGTLVGGGQTFRCPVAGGLLAPGANFLSVIVNLSDGTSVGNTATWNVDDNTEP